MTNPTPQEAVKARTLEALHPRGFDLLFEPETNGDLTVRYALDHGDVSPPQAFINPQGQVQPAIQIDPEIKRALRQAKVLATRKLYYNLTYLAGVVREAKEEAEDDCDGEEEQTYQVILKVMRELDSPLLDADFDVPGFIRKTLIPCAEKAFLKAYTTATLIPEVDEEEIRQSAGWLAFVGAIISEEFSTREREGL